MSQLLLQTATPNATSSYIMMGAMLVVVYLVMFLPQRRQQKKVAQMRAGLDVGDEVLTQGGIIGRVVSLKEDTVVIETGNDRVKLRIVRGAIAQNLSPKDKETAAK